MRSNLLIFLAMLSCNLISAQIVSNGLVAKYYFNSNNANDEVGDNDGVVNGATISTDRFGNSNMAYSFDGINDYILLGDSSEFQFSTGDFSISVWAYYTASQEGHILQKRNGNNLSMYNLSVLNDPQFAGVSQNFWIYLRSNTSASRTLEGGVLSGAWHNIVLTHNYATGSSVFVDGVLIDTDTTVLSGEFNVAASPLVIGAGSGLNALFFNGKIDDIRLYNRAINAAEVDSLFNEPNPATVNLSQDLAGHWSFNNADATDETANNNDGVINGAVLVQDRFGNPNKAYSFSQGQYISVPDADTLDGMTSGFSLSFWVLAPDVNSGTSNNLISKFTHCSGSGDDSYNFRINSAGQLWAQIDDAGGNDMYQESNAVIDDSSWHHIALVWNRPNVMVYIDGVADLAGTYSGFNFDFNNSPEVLAFGHQVTDACGGAYQYGELLDDIRLYSRAINAAEVDSLFNEPNPINTAITEVEGAKNVVNFFPNPSSGLINYSAAADIEEIEVLNLAGQRVAALRPQGRQGQISLDLNAGFYLLRSRLSDGMVQSDKIVIQK